jgi:hypothetical protein
MYVCFSPNGKSTTIVERTRSVPKETSMYTMLSEGQGNRFRKKSIWAYLLEKNV